jgi:hypothetical protein
LAVARAVDGEAGCFDGADWVAAPLVAAVGGLAGSVPPEPHPAAAATATAIVIKRLTCITTRLQLPVSAMSRSLAIASLRYGAR